MDRIRKWMQQIPIPAAFVLCGMAALLCALSLTRATMWFAQKNKGEIAAGYAEAEVTTPSMEAIPEQEQQPNFVMLEPEPGPSREALPKEEASTQSGQQEQEQEILMYIMPANIPVALPEEEKKKYDFYENLDNMAAILWYSLCLCLASLVFYLWKMKKPLQVLNQAARKIAENDLNFEIDYQGLDELGRLCQAFESMRRELAQSNKKMWNSMEERKRLNAAFAHDLRTPLTVLQGHTDILFDALNGREQEADPELLSDLSAISNQITRMNSYLDTMSALRRLEDYEPCLRAVRAAALEELLEDTAASLFPGGKAACVPSGIRTAVSFEMESQELWLDREAFSQIYENLLSNAARYARERIDIRLYEEQDFLVLEVADDGAGFTQKDLQSAFAPYYRGDRSKPASSAHFGLGLYICSLLAGKLGGKVQLANGENGGAKVMVKLYAQACKRALP
ncbi:MAG: HAMP domain-containing histidine kinase [Lachnospiraceae bacterium]|nr:HAMP domain-containing sensor histidine kinase [uncultured Acetatifactor sp.]MCI9218745.1 HAMP domain-containing histidine kinase [Lachnospiraceae bacterium]